MRSVLQRVSSAEVRSDGKVQGKIDQGLVILLGIKNGDGDSDLRWMVEKVINLRIFEDDEGKMNRSLTDIGGSMLIISQFTLYGDCRKGRRPGFSGAAPPAQAKPLYERFIQLSREKGITVETGIFQAEMAVNLVNDGPVTLLLDSEKTF